MPRDSAKLNYSERVAALALELQSPAGIATADKLIEQMKHELRSVVAMRDSAAILHGLAPLAPTTPPAAASLPPSNMLVPSVTTGNMLMSSLPGTSTFVASAEVIRASETTVRDLVNRYINEATSNYRGLRYKTRELYDTLIKRVLADCGNVKLTAMNEQYLRNLYGRWNERGKTSMAHAQITMLRTMANFVTKLGDPDADRLATTLHRMHFSVAKAQSEALSAEQAEAVGQKLRDMGFSSMALAQALQHHLMLRQTDTIGQWVPVTEPGDSDVFYADRKWLRGLRWEEIDDSFVLRHVSVDNRGDEVPIEADLKPHAAVMEELEREVQRKGRPSSGPVIVCENTGLPWMAHEFRKRWRMAADVCGVPKTVKNMNSRIDADTMHRRKKLRPELRLVTKSR